MDKSLIAFEGGIESLARGSEIDLHVSAHILFRIQRLGTESLIRNVTDILQIRVESYFPGEGHAHNYHRNYQKQKNFTPIIRIIIDLTHKGEDLFILAGIASLEEVRQENQAEQCAGDQCH